MWTARAASRNDAANNQPPRTSVGQCTPSQTRDQPTPRAHPLATTHTAARSGRLERRRLTVHATSPAATVAAVVCPDGKAKPPAAPAQSPTGGRARAASRLMPSPTAMPSPPRPSRSAAARGRPNAPVPAATATDDQRQHDVHLPEPAQLPGQADRRLRAVIQRPRVHVAVDYRDAGSVDPHPLQNACPADGQAAGERGHPSSRTVRWVHPGILSVPARSVLRSPDVRSVRVPR
jgi:hypothetical protein